MGNKGMRFGIVLPTYPAGATVQGVIDVACAAEDLGFASAWSTDHVILPVDEAGPYESIFEPIVTLAHISAVIKKIRLGLSVIVVPQRNGIVLAKELATLDHLCDGRLIVGVGAGWNESEFSMLGNEDRFSVRGKHLDETINVWRHLWTDPSATFAGDFYDLPAVAFGPRPVQKNGPEIWVGGSSFGARARAGRVGSAWHPVGVSAMDAKSLMVTVHESAKEAGRIPPNFSPRLPMWVGTSKTESTTASKMQNLTGNPEEMIRHLKMYQNVGASEIICLFGSQHGDVVIQQMEVFAKEIMPAFTG